MQVLRYMFPAQFKLHNVFTSDVNPKESASQFRDYMDREEEIEHTLPLMADAEAASVMETLKQRLPKRLKGELFDLVSRMLVRHGRCAYTKLLEHYCPLPSEFNPKKELPHFAKLASSVARVSAFCRAVIRNVIPFELVGAESVQSPNWKVLMQQVDKFLRLRRFETVTLEDILQGLKTSQMTCFAAPTTGEKGQRMSLTESNKRLELLAELIYWLFDSFLIPLVRCNFYVTDSSSHRNRLFYFRQDVWQAMTEPAKEDLKQRMLEPMEQEHANAVLDGRVLGYSQLRFIPKDKGMRPVANLRRRMPVVRNGMKLLGKSINSTITPAFSVLNYERVSFVACWKVNVSDADGCL